METFFIIDDIADSFDYKNKYAIIEYLNDIKQNGQFHLVILTHNYDFYRTIKSRLGIYGDNKLLSSRVNGAILLVKDTLTENPFSDWKDRLQEPEVLIASIAFIRNLAEYTGNDAAFNKLTSLLHLKGDTRTITGAELKAVFDTVLHPGSYADFNFDQQLVYDLILQSSAAMCANDEEVSLEHKICLSIGIRLLIEVTLISAINDPAAIAAITKNQTSKLIKKFKSTANPNAATLLLAEKVMLMTPENIHVNSFMFEPILDMSSHHLKSLYREVAALVPA